MGYTGYKVIQYIDDNPNSPTYGETWTELVLDTEHCPNGSGDWELVSSNCELSTSGYTGRRVYTYYNNVTNEYSSTTSADSSCKTSSLDEIWTNSGDSYCEQDEDGKYTGYGLQRQVQTNSNLINYMEIRDVRVSMSECLEKLEPEWQDLYKVCHIESSVSGQLYYDGTADILQIDINPSSETFNQTRTINVPDEECIAVVCDEIVEEWKFVDDLCGNQVPASYNLPNLTYNTVYHIYQKYQKCIVEGTTVRETPTGIYSAQTYQTGVEDCKYRWIDSEETVCIGSKISLRYSNSDVYEKPCDSNTALTSGETRPSGYQYSAMTDAFIGDCVTSIGESAFTNCYSLTSIDIPDSVTSIGDYTFRNCSGLTSCTIGSGVTSIGTMTFYNCYSLSSCTIGSGVTTIGNSTFSNCSGITSINIPNSVTSIGGGAFFKCSGLTSINIPDSVTTIGNQTFEYCSSLTSINIPSGVTSIGDYAFESCRSLTSIDIPSGVTSIGYAAFASCRSLTSITVNATTPPTLGNAAFEFTNNCPIYVPCASINAYKTASGWSNYANRFQCFMPPLTGKFRAMYSNYDIYEESCNSSTELTTATTRSGGDMSAMTTAEIGSCINTIGNYALSGCTSLSSVTIPNSVTTIKQDAFRNCSGLTSIDIPNSVTTISSQTFIYCTSLTSVTIPDSVTTLGQSTFMYCSGLTSAIIGNGLSKISDQAFIYCSGLTNVSIGSGVTEIGNAAFQYCSKLSSVTIPDSVTTIGRQAFYGCSGLTSINIPSGVTSIGNSTFNRCSNLTSVTIPDSVTTIGGYAFYNCSGLTSINIPSGVTSISEAAFYNCSGLTSCTIGSSVTSIGNSTFYGCSSLTSIDIPSGVTSIGSSAFRYCSGLTSIAVNATTPPTLGNANAFTYTNNCPIYVPSGSVNAYKTATNWSTWASRIMAIPNS